MSRSYRSLSYSLWLESFTKCIPLQSSRFNRPWNWLLGCLLHCACRGQEPSNYLDTRARTVIKRFQMFDLRPLNWIKILQEPAKLSISISFKYLVWSTRIWDKLYNVQIWSDKICMHLIRISRFIITRIRQESLRIHTRKIAKK